jgi:hypothetical protein
VLGCDDGRGLVVRLAITLGKLITGKRLGFDFFTLMASLNVAPSVCDLAFGAAIGSNGQLNFSNAGSAGLSDFDDMLDLGFYTIHAGADLLAITTIMGMNMIFSLVVLGLLFNGSHN